MNTTRPMKPPLSGRPHRGERHGVSMRPGGITIRMSGIDWQDVALFGERARGSPAPCTPTRMSGIDWQDVPLFGERACGSLDPVAVQRRTLPDFIRLLQADSGAIHLIDHRHRGLVATIKCAPVRMLGDFE